MKLTSFSPRAFRRAAATAAILSVAWCAAACQQPPAVEDSETSDHDITAECAGVLSPIGRAVATKLQSGHRRWEGIKWEVTCDNAIVGDWLISTPPVDSYQAAEASLPVGDRCTSGADCNVDFELKRCLTDSDCESGTCGTLEATVGSAGSEPESLCLGHSDFAYDEMYRVVASAEREIVVAGLWPFAGGYRAVLRNAINVMNERAKAAGTTPVVRVLYGMGDEPAGKVLESLARDIRDDARVQISVGTYGGAPKSWNHAKMVVADGREAIVGGHAWGSHDYNRANPVHDSSMRVEGSAATAAVRYFDYLWDYTRKSGTVKDLLSVPAGKPVGPQRFRGSGSVPVIAVGSSGGIAINITADTSADDAIFALMDAAQSVIRLDQQDLNSMVLKHEYAEIPQHISPELLEHIGLALMRDVDVYLMLSNKNWWNGWTVEQTAQNIRDYVLKNASFLAKKAKSRSAAPTDAARVVDLLCRKLHVAAMRDGAGALVTNHNKVVIVDDEAFYIGSQNLYPGGLADRWITQLAEFGYIVDDAASTKTVVDVLWTPAWEAAVGQSVSGAEARSCVLR
jgi:phosphatidylserine/phosphatidylglycerophosphate/cardiolipin synthase-like enzyme